MNYQLTVISTLMLLSTFSKAQISPVDVIKTVETVSEVAKTIDNWTSEDTAQDEGRWDDAYHTSDEAGERATQYSFDVNHPPKDAIRKGCICMDGTSMDLKGAGACAGYGGVRHWIYQKKDGIEVQYPTERHLQHPAPLSEEEIANLSAHNKQQSYKNSYNRGVEGRLGWEELMAIIIICVTIAFITKTIWSSRRE
ncbi:MAG: hypothetical protein ACPG19_13945 [Saprospiraceae bacterium]